MAEFTLLMHVSVSPFACDQSGVTTLPRLSECTTYLWSGRLPSGRLITCKRNWRCVCHYTHQSFKTKIQYIACILDLKQWLNHILSQISNIRHVYISTDSFRKFLGVSSEVWMYLQSNAILSIILTQLLSVPLNEHDYYFPTYPLSVSKCNFHNLTRTMPTNTSDKGQVVYSGFGRRMHASWLYWSQSNGSV